jgi:hypothetical protein
LQRGVGSPQGTPLFSGDGIWIALSGTDTSSYLDIYLKLDSSFSYCDDVWIAVLSDDEQTLYAEAFVEGGRTWVTTDCEHHVRVPLTEAPNEPVRIFLYEGKARNEITDVDLMAVTKKVRLVPTAEGRQTGRYITPEASWPERITAAVGNTADAAVNATDASADFLKWGTIAVAGSVALYVLWPTLPVARSASSRIASAADE